MEHLLEEVGRQRREAEDAREAAELANRAKSAFLANMSHELRTPLSAVIGYAELLEEEAEDLEQSISMKDLGKIKSNAKHLLGLINDVLDLSKVEANKMETFVEEIEVAAFVREAADTVSSLVTVKHNTLVLDIPEGLGTMRSDAVKLRRRAGRGAERARRVRRRATQAGRCRPRAPQGRDRPPRTGFRDRRARCASTVRLRVSAFAALATMLRKFEEGNIH